MAHRNSAALLRLFASALATICISSLAAGAAHAATNPCEPEILRAADRDGTPGNPVLFPADLLPDLQKIKGDKGARDLLRRHAGKVHLIPLPEAHALTDLDTPEDWAAWRARR